MLMYLFRLEESLRIGLNDSPEDNEINNYIDKILNHDDVDVDILINYPQGELYDYLTDLIHDILRTKRGYESGVRNFIRHLQNNKKVLNDADLSKGIYLDIIDNTYSEDFEEYVFNLINNLTSQTPEYEEKIVGEYGEVIFRVWKTDYNVICAFYKQYEINDIDVLGTIITQRIL